MSNTNTIKLLEDARKYYLEENYEKSLKSYIQLKEISGTNIYDANIALIKRKTSLDLTPITLGDVFKAIGIEQIYVVNLKRRPDRKIKILKEFKKHNLTPKFVEAEDALNSEKVINNYNNYISRKAGSCKYSEHIELKKQNTIKRNITRGAFAYNLSQEKVIVDAINNKYQKIAVFDDDVFFTSSAMSQLKKFIDDIKNRWKICLLGASEYSDYNFIKTNILNKLFYSANPGKTCGSFGMLYSQEIYNELLSVIKEADGTYDNNILGYFYHKYSKECLVINKNICIPSIEESNIRDDKREQHSHSERMRWDIGNFEEWKKPIEISIIISNVDNLKYLSKLNDEYNDINIKIYYISKSDGLRPIISGYSSLNYEFLKQDIDSLFYSKPLDEQKQILLSLGLPFSEYLFIWATDEAVTIDSVRAYIVDDLEGKEIKYFTLLKDFGKKYISKFSSIIIPSFRPAVQVWPTVKSAINQKKVDYEVIIVNDNPQNASFKKDLETLIQTEKEKYKLNLPKITIVEHSINRNASAGRNTGFMASEGEYVFFLDDDDIYEENRIFNAMNKLSKEKNKFQAIYCGYKGTWNGHQDLSRFKEGNFLDDIIQLNYANHYMCTNTVTYHRDAFASLGGFNESYRRHQDLELNLRFFMKFNMCSVNTFDVHNRPTAVDETYKASVDSLISLKTKFFNDFKHLINLYDDALKQFTIQQHANDIFKRGVSIEKEKELILLFLAEVIKLGK
jgi:glycosyltransferase involved in cell wall biosynthesis/GR25 family glycosyltransferase involved in LPS biosynthesis